jgi:hypothetical protein
MKDYVFIRPHGDGSIDFSINPFRIVILRGHASVHYRPYGVPQVMYSSDIALSRTGVRLMNMLRYYRVGPECCLALADKGRIYRS